MGLPTFCCTTYNIDGLRLPSQPLYAQENGSILVGGTGMPSNASLVKVTVRRYEHAVSTDADLFRSFLRPIEELPSNVHSESSMNFLEKLRHWMI
jgi:hypothetical protein